MRFSPRVRAVLEAEKEKGTGTGQAVGGGQADKVTAMGTGATVGAEVCEGLRILKPGNNE